MPTFHLHNVPFVLQICKSHRTHKRSILWKSFKDEFLKQHPVCEICGKSYNLTVHHIVPVSQNKFLELVPSNCVTLCQGSNGCHFIFGHRGQWRDINSDIKNTISQVKNQRLSICESK